MDAEASAWRERSGAVGLRKLLGRKPPKDPLEHLAEPGRETGGGYRTGPFAPLKTQGEAPPVCVASVDKRVGPISVADSKRAVDPPRSRSGYIWRSEASRSKRAAWADMPERF
jgi:hypothetical protein